MKLWLNAFVGFSIGLIGIHRHRLEVITTVILGGLSISTVLTLVVIPVMYAVVDDGTQWFARLWKKSKPRAGALSK